MDDPFAKPAATAPVAILEPSPADAARDARIDELFAKGERLSAMNALTFFLPILGPFVVWFAWKAAGEIVRQRAELLLTIDEDGYVPADPVRREKLIDVRRMRIRLHLPKILATFWGVVVLAKVALWVVHG